MQEFATRKAIAHRMDLRLLNCLFRKYRMAVRIMKLTAFILFAACIQLSARGLSQTVTISVKDAPLFTVLKAIEKQTGFTFIVNSKLLQTAKPVSVTANNLPLQQVLDICFKDQPMTYRIIDKVISVIGKEAKTDKVNFTPPLPQNIDVRGRVVDENGQPISGATVTVQGTNKSTSTDSKGIFELMGVDDKATLEISHVQYNFLTLKLSGSGFITAKLQVKVSALDELQVIAYGTTTKRFSTGNITSVKGSEIEKQPVQNPILALQGRVPGLFITQSNGLPGTGVSVRIQGQNSIERGTDPFYVIDGVPYTSQTLPTINSILGNSGNNAPVFIQSGSGNPLSFINPSDIESIEVLKDADATAIYGSRAANGAILITTKKGKSGQTRINVNMQQGWGKVPSKLNLLNTRQYIEMRKEAKMNDNAVISATDYDINGTWDSTKYTDWQKALLGGTSKYSDAQGSISGGNNLVQYLIGGGYHKETSVFPGDFTDQKGSMHINLNGASANQKFKVQTSINYLIDDNRLPSQDLTQKALQLSPNAPDLYNSDGSLNWALLPNGNATWINPLSFAIGYYKYRVNNLISNTTISYRIAKGLDIKTSFGYNKMLSDELQTTPMSSVSPPSRSSTLRRSVFGNGSMNSWILEPQITYNRKILNGNIEILVGSTFQESKNQQQQLTATGFNSDLVMEDIKSASSITANSNLISDYKYSAVFGRVNFNWAEKYIVNLTGRRDGSSRFGSANLFHNFGSIAGAWIFSKEKLLEQKLPLISFGKLRVSYGTTGNDQIGDYQFLNRYITTSGIAVAYQGIPSIEPDGIPNPYLQWEETKKLQFGLDLGILKNRILFNVNYARNRSSNQLLGYNLPIMTGVSGMIINFPATIENTSWELSLNTENLRFSNFRWNTNVNFTIPENKLIEFPNIESSSYASLLVIGKPFTIVKKYHFLGVDPAIGKYVFSDSKGNATSTPNTETDRTVIINTAPEFYAGFQNTFSFKGFELDFLFQYVKQKGANYSFGANRPGTMLNQPDYVLGRWQKPGDITSIQRYNSTTTLNLPYSFASGSSDAGYSDASFIRLRNVSFSWQLPPIWIRKLHLQNFRLYVHGQNLLTITDFKGLDPENKSTNSLPILRVITAGVQLSL